MERHFQKQIYKLILISTYKTKFTHIRISFDFHCSIRGIFLPLFIYRLSSPVSLFAICWFLLEVGECIFSMTKLSINTNNISFCKILKCVFHIFHITDIFSSQINRLFFFFFLREVLYRLGAGRNKTLT